MNNSLKDKLAKKSILIKFDEDNQGHSAMLSVDDHERFEINCNGNLRPSRVIATYPDGYISFYTRRVVNDTGNSATPYLIRPETILSTTKRDLVEAETFDCIKISYNNIFNGIKYDPNKIHPVDVLKAAGKDVLHIKNDVELSIVITPRIEPTHYPYSLKTTLDDLKFIFKSDSKFKRFEVCEYVDTVTKVISLYIKKPIDPKSVHLGLKRKEDDEHDYALLEYSGKYKYTELQRNSSYPINIKRAESMTDALVGAFNTDLSRELNVWFSFTEADYKKYYLDTILSILLGCAESAYYLLPSPDTSKKEQEFDIFLKKIEGIDIQPSKLKKFIKGARGAYLDRVTFEAKIIKLIKYCDLKVNDEEIFAQYLNQLRNNLMHGIEPNFDNLVDKDGKPIKPINILQVLSQLRVLVSSSLIKYLAESK